MDMTDKKSTVQLQQELDELLLWFESENVNLDEAVEKYKYGKDLIAELERRLQKAENTITKISKS